MAKAKAKATIKSRLQQERDKVAREVKALTEQLAIKLTIRDALDDTIAKGLELPDCTTKKPSKPKA